MVLTTDVVLIMPVIKPKPNPLAGISRAYAKRIILAQNCSSVILLLKTDNKVRLSPIVP